MAAIAEQFSQIGDDDWNAIYDRILVQAIRAVQDAGLDRLSRADTDSRDDQPARRPSGPRADRTNRRERVEVREAQGSAISR